MAALGDLIVKFNFERKTNYLQRFFRSLSGPFGNAYAFMALNRSVQRSIVVLFERKKAINAEVARSRADLHKIQICSIGLMLCRLSGRSRFLIKFDLQ